MFLASCSPFSSSKILFAISFLLNAWYKVEIVYNKIIVNDSDIVVCNYKKVYDDSKMITYHNVSENCKITNLYDNPEMVYKFDYAPWNKLYKKESY